MSITLAQLVQNWHWKNCLWGAFAPPQTRRQGLKLVLKYTNCWCLFCDYAVLRNLCYNYALNSGFFCQQIKNLPCPQNTCRPILMSKSEFQYINSVSNYTDFMSILQFVCKMTYILCHCSKLYVKLQTIYIKLHRFATHTYFCMQFYTENLDQLRAALNFKFLLVNPCPAIKCWSFIVKTQ